MLTASLLVAVTIKLPEPQGAGEFPIAITIPLGSSAPPRSIGPLDPAWPNAKVMSHSPETVKTMVAM